jgi:hypothetical protein
MAEKTEQEISRAGEQVKSEAVPMCDWFHEGLSCGPLFT